MSHPYWADGTVRANRVFVIHHTASHAMNLADRLQGRIHKHDICLLAKETQAPEAKNLQQELLTLLRGTDLKVAENAAWVYSHYKKANRQCLRPYRTELATMAMYTPSSTLCRLLLTILRDLPFTANEIPTDFLDFCLSTFPDEKQPTAIRVQCLYLSLELCRHYPELLKELEQSIHWLSATSLSPGLCHAQKQVLKAIHRAYQQ